MIRALSGLIKTCLFAAVILILGNWIHWGGKSVSEQVKTEMTQVGQSKAAGSLKRWGKQVKGDVAAEVTPKIYKEVSGKVVEKSTKLIKAAKAKVKTIESQAGLDSAQVDSPSDGDKIPSSERQKLRALIQELNTSTSATLSHDN